MAVRYYNSTDAGAPALRGNTPGDLIALLHACLVTGYGSKIAAGWTREFVNVGNTIAAFKQGPGSNNMYLRVDDTMVAATNALRYAGCVGYETMSDVNTGLPSPFPTAAQMANGALIHTLYNSTNAWATRDQARPWHLVADQLGFYLHLNTSPGASSASFWDTFYFGDIVSYRDSDPYGTVIMGQVSPNTTLSAWPYTYGGAALSSPSTGFYAARDYLGVSSSFQLGHGGDVYLQGSQTWGGGASTGLPYPNPVDNGIHVTAVRISEPRGSGSSPVRGQFPGMVSPCNRMPATVLSGDTFQGQGPLAGKTFVIFQVNGYRMFVEITGNWGR